MLRNSGCDCKSWVMALAVWENHIAHGSGMCFTRAQAVLCCERIGENSLAVECTASHGVGVYCNRVWHGIAASYRLDKGSLCGAA